MTDRSNEVEESYSDRSGMFSWDDSPEVRAARQPKAEQAAPAPEGENREADYWRDRYEEVADAVAASNDEVLDDFAFDTNWSQIESSAAAQIMDTLLGSGDSIRTESALSQWAEWDPATANSWLEDRQRVLSEAAHSEIEALKSQESDARLKTVADFISSSSDPIIAAQVSEAALASQADPGQIEEALPSMYERGIEAKRAEVQAFRERALRDSFRDPRVIGVAALDPKTGAERPVVAAEPLEVTQARMRPTKEWVQAQREAEVEGFRDAFADAARGSGFGEENRAGAARAEKARDELKLKADPVYRNRSQFQ
jgi:hypothetical protein